MNAGLHRWIFLIICFTVSTVCFAFLLLKRPYPVLEYNEELFQERIHTPVDMRSYNFHQRIERNMDMTKSESEEEAEPANTEEKGPVKTFIFHKVRSGDTLWKIARIYEVSIDSLVIDNDIHDPDMIFQGTLLKVRKGTHESL
jgi:LysM repeat protein